MMKKTTSALAIAALLGSGAASAVTFQVNDETTMSISTGVYWAFVESTDKDGNNTTNWSDNGSDIVFNAQHEGANGITTFLNIDLDEFGTPESEGQPSLDDRDGITTDEMSLGVAGDFGTITVGSDGNLHEGYVDGLKDIDAWSGVYGLAGDDSNMIKYDSVDLGALSFSVSANTYNDETADQSGTTFAGGVAYDLGGAVVTAAYNNRGGEAADDAFYGVGVSTNLGGVGVAATYEVDTLDTEEADMFSLTGTYTVDSVDLYGVVQSLSFDSVTDATTALAPSTGVPTTQTDDSFTQYLAGARYHISGNLSVWAEILRTGYENDQGDVTAIGVDAYF